MSICKTDKMVLLLVTAIIIFMAMPVWAGPNDMMSTGKVVTNPNAQPAAQLKPKMPPRMGTPGMACKDPGNPMGKASVNNGQPLKVGFEKGKFGSWAGSNFTPATGRFGIYPTRVNGDLKVPVYGRDCVKQVQVRATSGAQTKTATPNTSYQRTTSVVLPVELIDAGEAANWCRATSKPRPAGPGHTPPVNGYTVPASIHAKSIMNMGGPYMHEQAYGDGGQVKVQLQCWKE